MPDLGIWGTAAPYHIISYGTLLGTEIFQSFIGGIVAFKSLPRPAFSTLQSSIFPIYFGMQTALPAIMALTFPGRGPSALNGVTATGFAGVFAERNRYSVLAPLGTIFVTGLVNAVWVGPAATRTMRERKHQETRDGKKSYDKGPHSAEMQALNKKFGKLHGMSTLINLAGLVATLVYAGTLADLMR